MEPAPPDRPPLWRRLCAGLGAAGLVAMLVLIVSRSVEPHTSVAALLASAEPLVVIIALPTVALLLAARLSSRGGRAATGVGVALALASLMLSSAWLAAAYTGTVPRSSTGASLTLLSQNLEYGDVETLAARTARDNVDILVLVDLAPTQYAAVMRSTIPSSYAYSSGTGSTSRSHTLIFSKFPLTDERRLTPGGSSRTYVVTGSPIGRFVLGAVHPAPPYVDDSHTWLKGMQMIHDGLVAQRKDSAALPLLVAGDFNSTVDHEPFRRLLADAGLRDAAELRNAGWAPTFPANRHFRVEGFTPPPLVQIDHVLVSSRLTVTGLEMPVLPGSDHVGLLARISCATSAAARPACG